MPDDLDRRKVVILEDDPELIEQIQRRLQDYGYFSILVRRTRDIIKFLKAEKPQTMIMDVALPDVDGIALLQEIKADWEAKKTHVIVMSNYSTRVNYKVRDDVADIFQKPFDVESLLESVHRVAAMDNK
ncbi:MAG: response regulator [Chloroflexi bacterium]|nr:response regulator [Chloroflexota bacterium]